MERSMKIAVVSVILSLCLLLTGCAFDQNEPREGALKLDDVGDMLAEKRNKAAGKSKPSNHSQENGQASPTDKETSGKKDLEIASPATGKSDEDSDKSNTGSSNGKTAPPASESSDVTPPPKRPVPPVDPYDASRPTLMGLAIGDSRAKAVERLGNPDSTYTLEDDDGAITVYDYPGFSIGFSGADLVLFVDVSAEQVNPGLNGIRIGQTADVAVKAIGNPTTSSDYVMSYRTDGVVLKFDIDPATKHIRSIKLFGN